MLLEELQRAVRKSVICLSAILIGAGLLLFLVSFTIGDDEAGARLFLRLFCMLPLALVALLLYRSRRRLRSFQQLYDGLDYDQRTDLETSWPGALQLDHLTRMTDTWLVNLHQGSLLPLAELERAWFTQITHRVYLIPLVRSHTLSVVRRGTTYQLPMSRRAFDTARPAILHLLTAASPGIVIGEPGRG